MVSVWLNILLLMLKKIQILSLFQCFSLVFYSFSSFFFFPKIFSSFFSPALHFLPNPLHPAFNSPLPGGGGREGGRGRERGMEFATIYIPAVYFCSWLIHLFFKIKQKILQFTKFAGGDTNAKLGHFFKTLPWVHLVSTKSFHK